MKTSFKVIFILAFLFVLASFGAAPTQAAPINVGCNVTELIDAINSANASPEADTLNLAAGCDYALVGGLPDITSDITINGNNATIEPGQGVRLLEITDSGVLALANATLRGANTDCGPASSGGAIHNAGGMLNVQGVTFSDNSAGNPICPSSGGSIFNGEGGEVTITGGVFENGTAYSGGAIYNLGTLTVQGVSFLHNRGSSIPPMLDDRGGSITTFGEATISGSVFINGSAVNGGGIWNSGNLNVNTSVFRKLGWGFGAGIYNYGTAVVAQSLFESNEASYGHNAIPGLGGAIYNSGEMTLRNSTVSQNRSGFGGGIWNKGNMDLSGATLVGNSVFTEFVRGAGGGILNGGTLSIENSTITENHAEKRGGGILNKKELTLDNTTIAKNSAGIRGGNILNLRDGILSTANTIMVRGKPQNCVGLIADRGGNLRYPSTDSSCVGRYGNPKLGPLQDNGGSTNTMALQAGSTAIDAGSELACSNARVNNLDQRGTVRPLDGNGNGVSTCDIGAYEAPALPAPTCDRKPAVPTLVTPFDQGQVGVKHVRLDWDESKCSATYRVLVRAGSSIGLVAFRAQDIPVTESVTSKLETNQGYVWRVKACNDVGCSAWSKWWAFTVE